MKNNYLNIYNTLINYSRNKDLYLSLTRSEIFSDRLTFFLLHFAFYLKNFKNDQNKGILQDIYDFNFRQLELTLLLPDFNKIENLVDYFDNFSANLTKKNLNSF